MNPLAGALRTRRRRAWSEAAWPRSPACARGNVSGRTRPRTGVRSLIWGDGPVRLGDGRGALMSVRSRLPCHLRLPPQIRNEHPPPDALRRKAVAYVSDARHGTPRSRAGTLDRLRLRTSRTALVSPRKRCPGSRSFNARDCVARSTPSDRHSRACVARSTPSDRHSRACVARSTPSDRHSRACVARSTPSDRHSRACVARTASCVSRSRLCVAGTDRASMPTHAIARHVCDRVQLARSCHRRRALERAAGGGRSFLDLGRKS